MLYEEKISSSIRAAFTTKVNNIAGLLGINPDWLMAVMNSESGLNPQAKNAHGGATGLIQFMPSTAIGLGTTTDALYGMDATRQLDYVYAYFKPYKDRITCYEDLYLITFYPVALSKNDDFILGSEIKGTVEEKAARVKKIAEQNPSIDLNQDKKITKGEFKRWIQTRIPANVKQQLGIVEKAGKLASRNKGGIIVSIILLVASAILIRKYARR